MFGIDKTIAVQDPSYPVYVDTTVMMGNTGQHNGTGFDKIEYMVCKPENNFFPDLSKVNDSALLVNVCATAPLHVLALLPGLEGSCRHSTCDCRRDSALSC